MSSRELSPSPSLLHVLEIPMTVLPFSPTHSHCVSHTRRTGTTLDRRGVQGTDPWTLDWLWATGTISLDDGEEGVGDTFYWSSAHFTSGSARGTRGTPRTNRVYYDAEFLISIASDA